MTRLLYTLTGLVLIPACWAATKTLLTLLAALRLDSMGGVSTGALWLAAGFLLWLTLFFFLPRPVKTYVLAHELTHAFWGLLMGARVSKLRVGDRGGSVNLSKTNFFITLAPYFFPFYTMLALAVRTLLGLFMDLSPYEPFWLGLIGLTWSFHLTFTVATLMQEQPDVAAHGRIFSYVVIMLMNLLGISLWLVAAGSPTWSLLLSSLTHETLDAYTNGLDALASAWTWLRTR